MSSSSHRFSTLLPSSKSGQEATILLSGAFVLALLMGVVGGVLQSPSRNLPLLLSTLAGAQAALFGIVFAITVLGIQLTTNRYSPRLVFLFIEGWPFRATFGVFVVSIGLDILLLSLVNPTPSRVLTAGVAAAGGLSLAATGILYWFIRSTLAQSTPEGLIDTIANELPASRFLAEFRETQQTDAPHPLHRLYSLVMAALSRGESETAYYGVRTLDEVTTRGLEHVQATEADIDESELSEAFGTSQEDYLPEIALHAYENEERRIATQSIETLGELGQIGLEGDTEPIARYSSAGLADIIDELPLVAEANRTRNAAAETLGDLLKNVVPHSQQTYDSVLHDLNYRLVVLLRRDADRWVYETLIREHLDRTLPNLLERLLDQYAEEVEDSELDWHQPHDQNDGAPSQSAQRFLRYHRAVREITKAILRYTHRNDVYPLATGNFREAWRKIATTAAQSSLSSYAVLICQTLIKTAYYVDRLEGNRVGSWDLAIANVMDDSDPTVAQQAFEDLKAGDYSNHKLVSIYLQPEESDETGVIDRLLGTDQSDELSFEEWLDPFQQQVYERYERLQEE